MTGICHASLQFGVLAVLLGAASVSEGYESDQFTNRLVPIEDSTELLDGKVNDTIARIAAEWSGPRDDWIFVNRIYHAIGGLHWVDRIERWAMKSPEIDKLPYRRHTSIYKGHPFWATRVAALFGVGPTIKVAGQLIGSDKLGHFISQGRKFYARFLRMGDEARAARRSAYTERALFGQLTTGIYSNADLVANYEGHRFFRSLFEDGIVPGKRALLNWTGTTYEVQERFTFADFVNEYWDEALNISHFDSLLYPYMKERISQYCPDYQQAPEKYRIRDEAALHEKYGHLQLRDTSELRLRNLCGPPTKKAVTGWAGRPE